MTATAGRCSGFRLGLLQKPLDQTSGRGKVTIVTLVRFGLCTFRTRPSGGFFLRYRLTLSLSYGRVRQHRLAGATPDAGPNQAGDVHVEALPVAERRRAAKPVRKS
jgi:hypothetical protein